MEARWQRIGGFRALVNPRFDSPALRAALADIESIASGDGAILLQAGRHKTVRMPLETGLADGRLDAVAKFFGSQSPVKDLWDRLHSTKARRTYEAALFMSGAGIGTTPPVACLERWRGARLDAGIFVSAYVDDALCFKDRLVALWQEHAPYSAFLETMEIAARGIKALHDAGCVHGDLGNQNVFFTRRAPDLPYCDALFLDLNRARFCDAPADENARARDLARICLPEKFLETFLRLYWGGEPPQSFLRACVLWRKLFRFHSATRKFRHPFRELRYVLHPETAPAQAPYPPANRQWVWDSDAMRPAPVAGKRQMLFFLDPGWRRRILWGSVGLAKFLAGKAAASRNAASSASTGAIACADTQAPSCKMRLIVRETDSGTATKLMAASGLGRALVRFAMADGEETNARRLAVANALAAGGHGVAIQVLQRPEFLGGESAEAFAARVLDGCGFAPDWLCVGQGVNTLVWGIRTVTECKRLAAAGNRAVASCATKVAVPLVASAIESPVLQTGCSNIPPHLAGNPECDAIALAWREGDGELEKEIETLRALAEETAQMRRGIVVIADTPFDRRKIAALPGGVREICAVRFE